MEGLLLGIEAIGSAFVFLSAVSLLVLATSTVFFGYMAEEEKNGRRFSWAEWPISGSRKAKRNHVLQVRLAA